jgi:outer membrane lipoprotein-sorting protein
MHKFISKAVMTALFAVILGGAGVTAASAQNILGQIFNRLDVNNKSIQSLEANVTMSKTDSVLKTTDVMRGKTSYLPKYQGKRYMRLDWIKPVEHISVIGDEYELYKPSINVVYKGKTAQAKNSASAGSALSFMSMSKAELKANYDVVYIGEENLSDGSPTWHLQLTPKTAQNYKMADLWVDPNGMPRQAKILEKNNDTTTVLLSGINKNITIKAEIFTLNYDKKKVTLKKV